MPKQRPLKPSKKVIKRVADLYLAKTPVINIVFEVMKISRFDKKGAEMIVTKIIQDINQ